MCFCWNPGVTGLKTHQVEVKLTGREVGYWPVEAVRLPGGKKTTTATGGFWRATSSGETVDLRTLWLDLFGGNNPQQILQNSHSHQSWVMFVVAGIFFCVGVDGWCKQSHFKPHVFFELFGIPYGSSSTKTSYRCLQIGESYQSISKKIPIIHIANTCSFCGTLKTENQSKLGCNIEHLYEIRSHGS